MAAAWGLLDELGVIGIIDEAAGRRPAGQPLSTGAYLALAALNRLVAPCSKMPCEGDLLGVSRSSIYDIRA